MCLKFMNAFFICLFGLFIYAIFCICLFKNPLDDIIIIIICFGAYTFHFHFFSTSPYFLLSILVL